MDMYVTGRGIAKGIVLFFIVIFLMSTRGMALELNADGQALIQEAGQAYHTDMRDRPTLSDSKILGYAREVVEKLVPKGKQTLAGVNLSMTLIESPRPELYAYVDGHVIMTTGLLFAMDNEAQLAGVLAHEIAHVCEGYYIDMYQEIKRAEKRQRNKALAGALFGSLLDVAVDYAVELEDIRQTDRMFSGEITYRETMKRMAAVGAAQSAYYSIKDVIQSIPSKDEGGNPIDPRFQFEAVADAQGMEYLALAGYDTSEAAKGWDHVHEITSQMAREEEQALGPWASQLRETRGLMEMNMQRLRQSLGASGLVQTISDSSPTRSQFVANLTSLQEVQAAQKSHGSEKRQPEYIQFLKQALVPRAEQAMGEERYEQALQDYKALYEKGIRTAPIAYGMAKCMLGDFAFGASPAEKKQAEALYKESIKLDSKYAPAYRGLGELYDDWERYEEAAHAYRDYLKVSPKANDQEKIERKIKTLERKASR